MPAAQTPVSELELLREKRKTLEQMVRIAEAVERLHHGLTASLLLGKPTHLIPKKVVESFEAMDEKTQMLPSKQLHRILEQLQSSIQQKLASILQIAALDDTDLLAVTSEPDAADNTPETLLREYQKLAQTAVALRILLHARGEQTGPTELPVQADNIRQQISDIAKRENRCRSKVKQQVNHLIQDTQQLLKRKDLPNGMQEILQASIDAFQANLAHIEAGGNLQNMPVTMEIIEVADTENSIRQNIISTKDKAQTKDGKLPELEAQLAGKRTSLFGKIINWIAAKLS